MFFLKDYQIGFLSIKIFKIFGFLAAYGGNRLVYFEKKLERNGEIFLNCAEIFLSFFDISFREKGLQKK